jgi:hypothetical protein
VGQTHIQGCRRKKLLEMFNIKTATASGSTSSASSSGDNVTRVPVSETKKTGRGCGGCDFCVDQAKVVKQLSTVEQIQEASRYPGTSNNSHRTTGSKSYRHSTGSSRNPNSSGSYRCGNSNSTQAKGSSHHYRSTAGSHVGANRSNGSHTHHHNTAAVSGSGNLSHCSTNTSAATKQPLKVQLSTKLMKSKTTKATVQRKFKPPRRANIQNQSGTAPAAN